MNVLVTAGNTVTPIDKVRCITNIFTGRTGAQIALHAHERGHDVTLMTSHPDVVAELRGTDRLLTERWAVIRYQTFDDLQTAMAERMRTAPPDALVHSAAVSDYHAAGVYAPDSHTRFRASDARWESEPPETPGLVDVRAGKVKSDAPELWIRLLRAPKLVDLVRCDWKFTGVLVKFKLEVGVSDERLLEIAERSRWQSAADLMVANTLEGAASWAYVGPVAGAYQRVNRGDLAARVIEQVEVLHREMQHG